MTYPVLVVNPGSSSLKLAVLDDDDSRLAAQELASPGGRLDPAALAAYLDAAPAHRAVGVRVVHGGELRRSTVVDAAVVARVETLAPMAPLHNPPAAQALRALLQRAGDVPVVACFDTAFHAAMPAAAATYAVPWRWVDEWGVRRYGFHGLSHAYAARRAAELLERPVSPLRLVTCHLGSGASLAAVLDGVSVDTTMGFTPMEGLVMSRRSGSIDPGVLLWLQRDRGLSADQVEEALDREAGLLGLSGVSGDMRVVLAEADRDDPRCRLAIDVYVHRLRGMVASMAASLGWVDALVFTGGVGENSAVIRERVCAGLGLLGVPRQLADAGASDAVISGPGAHVPVLVVHAREDLQIAHEVRVLLGTGGAGGNGNAAAASRPPASAAAAVTTSTTTIPAPSAPARTEASMTESTTTASTGPLTADELRRIHAYWRAANYLSVGQIYLLDNPLLREPLRPEHVKPRLLGHWGTTPGLNLVYVHMNRVIRERDLDAIYIAGPGHGGPGLVANTWLEGTYSEIYTHITQDGEGMRRLFRQFSFPGGIPSHAAPETPGSIHEGGELGYALMHAYGAAFDNPDLVVCCVIGDGEAETGPLATSWHSNKFLDAARDGAVLPVLHLNGYKIANPTVLARIPESDLVSMLQGCGYRPIVVAGDDPMTVHQALAAALDDALDDIGRIQHGARRAGRTEQARWPMIVLRTPKGWTGPREVDGVRVEGTFRAHQVPVTGVRTDPGHLAILEGWMRSYRPEELFDEAGRPVPEVRDLPPRGTRRMSANPHANGGLLLRSLDMPDFRDYAVEVPGPGVTSAEATRVLGRFLRDVMRRNMSTFRVFGPDETASNRLDALFEVTGRTWDAAMEPDDDHMAPDGRVMEVLSEHLCQGWLEGYLLTGRHGLFNCYEAFIHIIDSMFNQHAKWLKVTRDIPWRRPIASLNYLLTSHVWRQDHNGFSHQDPGFIDHVVNKKAEIIRVYLPPDANCLLSVADHCLRSRDYVNVVVAGKQPALNWLSMEEAVLHCTRGIGIWDWASNDGDQEPDVVMACAGDIPTLETMSAVALLRQALPELRIRVVNVVDLMRLQPASEHPHGLGDAEFDTLFTRSRPVIFAYHGYPWLIHRLTYRRTNHANIHVRGYKEEGTTTTPFDMVMLNDLDRYHLVMDVIDRVPGLGARTAHLRQRMQDARLRHRQYTRDVGDDMPDVRDWTWPAPGAPASGPAVTPGSPG